MKRGYKYINAEKCLYHTAHLVCVCGAYVSTFWASCKCRCLYSSSTVFFQYLELILFVFGALVKGPVISEPPDVIELVEAFDVVRHSVSLQHILTLWDGGYSIDLQVWKHGKLRKTQEKVTRESNAD